MKASIKARSRRTVLTGEESSSETFQARLPWQWGKLFFFLMMITLTSCDRGGSASDASGTFEADEVVVSSELAGKILSFNIEEGSPVAKDSVVGMIDAVDLSLQKEQVNASIESLRAKTSDVSPQVRLLEEQLLVQQSQLSNIEREKGRTEKLLQQDAATGKQLDDINSQLDVATKQIAVTRQQINVHRSAVSTQNRGVLSEGSPLKIRVEQLNEQLQKAKIINPLSGTVLTKYAQAGEVTSPGKALYKIADLSVITLRAYISGIQLPEIKLGQEVTVLIDSGKNEFKQYPGTITWISDKAEFTPKTIQTKEERANLVYGIKVKVRNDGYLKIGMYGEVKFNKAP